MSYNVNKGYLKCVDRQANTTNQVVTLQRMCVGFGFIVGDASAEKTETVTLPITYTTIGEPIANYEGFESNGGATTYGNQTADYTRRPYAASAATTSAFSAGGTGAGANTFASGFDFYYTWIYVGSE